MKIILFIYKKKTFTDEDIGYPTVRIKQPGYMYTCDYRTDRLNINLDENLICTRVTIG
jgi:hypothetical protein